MRLLPQREATDPSVGIAQRGALMGSLGNRDMVPTPPKQINRAIYDKSGRIMVLFATTPI